MKCLSLGVNFIKTSIMAKKGNGGKGKAPTQKNKDMIGGKNTLPQKNGKVDIKKVIQDGKKEQAKPFTERKGIKKPQSKIIAKPISPKKEVAPVKGVSKLKAMATKATPLKSVPAKKMETPKKSTAAKGLSKLKTKATKAVPQKQTPTKKVETPKKAVPAKGLSKFKAAAPKTKPITAKAPVKKVPSKGR